MATKAERYRYEAERSGKPHPKPKKAEATPAAKPSRKGKARQKGAAALKGKQLLSLISPHHRHDAKSGGR
jgi:hypothetical protein